VRRQLTGLVVLLAALALLPACGSSATPASGIYGIAVTNRGGMIPYPPPSPSPLPSGFGLSDSVPAGNADLVVTAVDGSRAGKVVARLYADPQGIFRLSLLPGTYSVSGTGFTRQSTIVSVQSGAFTRAVVPAYWRY
jgi:hypothetical protein